MSVLAATLQLKDIQALIADLPADEQAAVNGIAQKIRELATVPLGVIALALVGAEVGVMTEKECGE